MIGRSLISMIAMIVSSASYAQDRPDPQTVTVTRDQQTAQGTPDPATSAPPEKESWKAPWGGTFTAGFAVLNDYSYRGISQTQRQVAVQAAFGYETPTVSEKIPLSAYLGAWGSNVNFPGTGTTAEIDVLTGLKLKLMDDKLTFDLGYIRYNYLSAPSSLFYDFNEFGLVAGYDFGFAQVSAAVRYSPNFFANSGNAWYKWASVTVPMPFIHVNDNVAFKAFGTSTTAFPTTTTGTGSSASSSRSTASTSPPSTRGPTSAFRTASAPRTAPAASSSASPRPSDPGQPIGNRSMQP